MSSHSVYVIHMEGSQCYKVGVSDKPMKRLKTLQCANPRKLSILHTFWFPTRPQAFSLESKLHKEFYHHKIRGEWFELDDDTLIHMCRRAEHIGQITGEGSSRGSIEPEDSCEGLVSIRLLLSLTSPLVS